jgi:alpha-tubulin suppressor-like RCC1 family protein
LAVCNEAYACIGPDARLTAILNHTCLIADDAKVWCWGENPYGELGDETTETRGNPVLVRGLPGPAIDVSAGYGHTCAIVPAPASVAASSEDLVKSGDVYCWGNNLAGQSRPDSPPDQVARPSLVDAGGVRFTAVSAGQAHSCAISEARTVFCWGFTNFGQCGIAPAPGDPLIAGPTQIPMLDNVRQIETIKDHTCARRDVAPTLVCWGSNTYLLPDPSPEFGEPVSLVVHKLGPAANGAAFSASPVPVDLGSEVRDIGMGFESSFAVTKEGRAYAWGWNLRRQLGVANTASLLPEPAPIVFPRATGEIAPLGDVVGVGRSDGSDQCAEMEFPVNYGGPYLCWGGDDTGELGTGKFGFSQPIAAPAVALPSSARGMVHGSDHGCVLAREDGVDEIWCWGWRHLVANGSTDARDRVPQPEPRPIVWDPANFVVPEWAGGPRPEAASASRD